MTWITENVAAKRSTVVLWIFAGSLLVGIAVGLLLVLSGPKHGSEPEPVEDPIAAVAQSDVQSDSQSDKKARLRLESVPEGAEIVGPNDEVLGETPLELHGDPAELSGIYTAWADGFEPLQRKVSVAALEAGDPIILELQPMKPIRCVIRTSPAGAVVTDSGVQIGTTPTVVEVVPGNRRLIDVSLGGRLVSLELRGTEDCGELIEFAEARASAEPEKVTRPRSKSKKERSGRKKRAESNDSGTWRVRPELSR